MSSNSESKRIFLSPPHLSGQELDYIQRAIESNYIAPLGPMVDAFEMECAQAIGLPHALAVSSGTAAMHLALRALGIKRGDCVIASTLTFIGSISPIRFLGAEPFFVDSERSTWNMDPDLLPEAIERCRRHAKMPAAVVPTEIYGQPLDMKSFVDICDSYDIPLILDSAESLGSTYDNGHDRSGARAVILSFNGNKIITTSGGGMLLSGDKLLIDQSRFLSQQARDPEAHYEHSTIGYNYRMSNILAAIGRSQLKVLNERVEKRREIFNHYRNVFKNIEGIEFMPEASCGKSNRWLSVILISPELFGAEPEAVRQALEDHNIEARPVWKPMHLQPVFKECRCIGGNVAENLFKYGLCLPSGSAMTPKDLDRITSIVADCKK